MHQKCNIIFCKKKLVIAAKNYLVLPAKITHVRDVKLVDASDG
jgi:hypothetical protein